MDFEKLKTQLPKRFAKEIAAKSTFLKPNTYSTLQNFFPFVSLVTTLLPGPRLKSLVQ